MSMTPLTNPATLVDGSLQDSAAALVASLITLTAATEQASLLLTMAGFAGASGDTTDDLKRALAIHGHLVHQFNVKVRTAAGTQIFNTRASSASSAFEAAADRQGDIACGITVMPAEPDRRALAAAHRALRINGPLDDALKQPSLRIAINTWARKHQRHANPRTDFKSLAANDRD